MAARLQRFAGWVRRRVGVGARSLALIATLGAAVATGSVAAAVITLDFEGFTDGTELTNQYPGVTFQNALVLTAGIGLNDCDFPPHSPGGSPCMAAGNVVVDGTGPLTLLFGMPIVSLSGYFTYTAPLALDAFRAGMVPAVAHVESLFAINTVTSGASPNELIALAFAGGIDRVVITGDTSGLSFALDDLTFVTAAPSQVPEPPTLALMTLPFALLAGFRRRART